MSKSILYIMSKAPYGSDLAKESIEALLAMAIFDQALSALWLDDGVFQLVDQQLADRIDEKNFNALTSSFDIYGLEHRYVCEESLKARDIKREQLSIEATLLNSEEIKALLAKQQQLVSF